MAEMSMPSRGESPKPASGKLSTDSAPRTSQSNDSKRKRAKIEASHVARDGRDTKSLKVATQEQAVAKRGSKSTRKNGQQDAQESINEDIARMDPSLMADYVARQTKRFQPELSTVELEEKRIPGPIEKAFTDTSQYDEARGVNNLAAFLKRVARPRREVLAESPSEDNGSPHTIVVAAAALRAADIVRALRVYQTKDAMIAKLFARHIKLKDAINFTRSTRLGIAVGTPQRLLDLVNEGALSLDAAERIVLDASHINEKRRGIFEMKETAVPVVEFLALHSARERYTTDNEARKLEVVVF